MKKKNLNKIDRTMTEIERFIEDTDVDRRTEQLKPNRAFLSFNRRQDSLIRQFQLIHKKKVRSNILHRHAVLLLLVPAADANHSYRPQELRYT